MIIIPYNRRSLCMADDINCGVYNIQMPDNATLGDLIDVLLRGGNGNGRPVPQTSGTGWAVYSDIGKLADVSADKEQIDYTVPDGSRLSELRIAWVYAERADNDSDISVLASLF